MESQGMSCDSSLVKRPLETALLNSGSEKIKRPPNSFMLFARDHRKNVAKQHPDITNKVISSMLGNMWKNMPLEVKEKYNKEAKLLEKLHKKRYPDYVYSPIIARLMKKEKKKKKDEILLTFPKVQSENMKATTQHDQMSNIMNRAPKESIPERILAAEGRNFEPQDIIKHESNPNREGQAIDYNPDSATHSEYVPNNPEYLTERSPELCIDEDEGELNYPADCGCEDEKTDEMAMINETQHTRSDRSFECHKGPEHHHNIDHSTYRLPPYRMQESSSYFSDSPQYSHASSFPFYNDTKQYPMSPFYCASPMYFDQMPRSYRPPYNPYWSSRMLLYNQGRDGSYEDTKPFAYVTPYYPSDNYRPSFGYFDRPVTPYYRNSNFGFYPQFNADTRFSRAPENKVPVQNPGENGLCTPNSIYSGHDCQTGYLPSFVKPEPNQEPSNSSSRLPYDSYTPKRMNSECKSTNKFENKITHVRNNVLENENRRDSEYSGNNITKVNLPGPFCINKKPPETVSVFARLQDIEDGGKCFDITLQHI